MTPTPLSPAQARVVALCRRGMTLAQIAEHLGSTRSTVGGHLKRARAKGHVVKVTLPTRCSYANSGKWKVTAPKGTRWCASAPTISVTADTREEAVRTCRALVAAQAARTGATVPTVTVEAV